MHGVALRTPPLPVTHATIGNRHGHSPGNDLSATGYRRQQLHLETRDIVRNSNNWLSSEKRSADFPGKHGVLCVALGSPCSVLLFRTMSKDANMVLCCRSCGKHNTYGWDYNYGFGNPLDILQCESCSQPVVDHLTLLANLDLEHPTVKVCDCGSVSSISSRYYFRCGRFIRQ